MIAYKLMNQDFTTHYGFQWTLGKKETIEKEGNELCTDQVFHCYRSPEEAVLFNPIHANISNPTLVKVHCDIVADDGMKLGCKFQRPYRVIEAPVFTLEQKVVFAILCEKQAGHLRDPIPEYDEWADNFLKTKQLDYKAAKAAEAADAAAWAADAAAWAADAAAKAAEAADAAAWAAAWAAEAAAAEAAAKAADAAAWAAVTAKTAAVTAVRVSGVASREDKKIDFTKLAKQALEG